MLVEKDTVLPQVISPLIRDNSGYGSVGSEFFKNKSLCKFSLYYVFKSLQPTLLLSEALSVAANMQAAHCILTHFSQRYPRAPQASSSLYVYPVAVAFDFLRFSFPSQMNALCAAMAQIVQSFNLCEQQQSLARVE